jgi:hypothetical protein
MGRFLKRKRVAVTLGVVAALVVASAAFAYFTGATGSGSGSAAVGSSAQWAVSVAPASATFSPSGLSAIYPGNGKETIPFTITNNGHGNQNLATVAPTISTNAATGDAQDSNGNDISGCKAIWFNVVDDSANPALPADVTHDGGTYTGSVDLTMTDASSSQDACQGKAPAVVVTAGS